MTTRNPRSDSLESQVSASKSHTLGYQVPSGLQALTKRERGAWVQYCVCRSSWTEAELRGLHRIVKLETELAALRRMAAKTPRTYEKPSGTIAVHPIHTEVSKAQKLLHSELRVIGLNTSPERAVGASRNGKLAIPGGKPESRITEKSASEKQKLRLLK